MKKKNIALIAAGALGVGAFVGIQCDKRYNQLYALNTAYCTIRNALFGTEGTADIDVSLHYADGMPESKRNNARKAFENIKKEFFEEFGINFSIVSEQIGTSNRGIADLSIMFVPDIPNDGPNDTKAIAGLANRRTNIVYIKCSSDQECLEYTLMHELGHMFYAEHTDDPLCVMYTYNLCFRHDMWCDDERNAITEHKHRLWW